MSRARDEGMVRDSLRRFQAAHRSLFRDFVMCCRHKAPFEAQVVTVAAHYGLIGTPDVVAFIRETVNQLVTIDGDTITIN